MDIVAIDILSGLPVTTEGYKYILVVLHYCTKYSRAFPLVDAEASTCMRAIYDGVFALFGLPRQIHSDRGRILIANYFRSSAILPASRSPTLRPSTRSVTAR